MGSETERKKLAVLFVHGIVGNSRFFDFLLPVLPSNLTVKSLTLKGHDGDALAFSKASMKQWKSQVDDAVGQLCASNHKVIIVAHSMGTLFAVEQAVRGRVKALFLLNPPMCIRLTSRMIITSVKVMAGLTSDPVTSAARDAYGISIDYNILHYFGWPKRYLELFGEIRRVRKDINRIKCRTIVFIACRDEMVSPTSASFFRGLDSCEVVMLRDSGHYYYTDQERMKIIESFSAMVSEFLSC